MIRCTDLRKVYRQGDNDVVALSGVTIELPKGRFAAIMGQSGSGKSTLLHLMGGLDRPTSGDLLVNGRPIARLSDDELTLFRRTQIGFVFQFFNLLPTLTATENVALPLVLGGAARRDADARARELLARVGLDDRLGHLPEELSGGEIQRVAIARALVFRPPVLLADEPTGNLDSKTGDGVLDLLQRINQDDGCTIVMVTHSAAAAARAACVITLRDGCLVDELP